MAPDPRAPRAPSAGAPPRLEPPADPRRAAVRTAVVVALLGLVVLGSSLAGPWSPSLRRVAEEDTVLPEFPLAQPTTDVTAEPDPSPVDRAPDVLVDLSWLWGLVILLVALGMGLLVLRIIRRHQLRDPAGDAVPPEADPASVAGLHDPMPDLQELRSAVDAAAGHLRAEVRPADAVIAAWVALEAAAERSGVVRDPASTPTEFTVAVLGRTPADPAATSTLLDLYLRARFGEEHLGPDDVATAVGAVELLRTTLGTPP